MFCVCTVCELTLIWYCWPVVERMVTAPSSLNETVPLV